MATQTTSVTWQLGASHAAQAGGTNSSKVALRPAGWITYPTARITGGSGAGGGVNFVFWLAMMGKTELPLP